jgi:hypothetical protein
MQYEVGQEVTHKKHGMGVIVRKTGPTFIKSTSEWAEPTYHVQFGDKIVPTLYGDELRAAKAVHV